MDLSEAYKAAERWHDSLPDDIRNDNGLDARFKKVKEELGELGRATTMEEVRKELADVHITLAVLAQGLGVTPRMQTRDMIAKVEILHTRRWKRMPDGTIHHIPEPVAQ